MMNERIDKAVWVILFVSVGLYLSIPLLSILGCKEEPARAELTHDVDEVSEPKEPKEEYVDCSHKRLEMIDNWLFVATSFGEGSLLSGEYNCLDCGYEITITSAVAKKARKSELIDATTIGDYIDIEFNPSEYGDIKVITMPELKEPDYIIKCPTCLQDLPYGIQEPNEPEIHKVGKWYWSITDDSSPEPNETKIYYKENE